MIMRIVSVLALLGLLSVPALAQDKVAQENPVASDQPQAAATPDPSAPDVDPHNLALAQELVKSFDMKGLMQSITTVLMQSMVPLIDQENPGQGEKVKQITTDAVQKVMLSHLPELEKNKAIVYAQMFTGAELEQLQKFYASPVGQKMLQSTPEMMHRNAILDQSIMMQTVAEVRKRMLNELKKNGLKVPKAIGV